MDTEAIVRAAPLVKGSLLTHRNAVKKQIVRVALSSFSVHAKVSAPAVGAAAFTRLGIHLNSATVVAALDALATDNVLRHAGGDHYEILNPIVLPNFSSEVEAVWKEFKSILATIDADFDEHYVDKNVRGAFEDFLLEFFSLLAVRNAELSTQIETLADHDTDKLIDQLGRQYKLGNPRSFREACITLLAKATPAFSSLVLDVYGGLVNFSLISREGQIRVKDIKTDAKLIFLDTNVLAMLLCESDPSHPLVSAICKRSYELGIEVYYSRGTEREFWGFINGSKHEMRGLIHTGRTRVFRSQFIGDFLIRGGEWSDYVARMNDWKNVLRNEWGVQAFPGDLPREETTYRFALTNIRLIDQVREESHARRDPSYQMERRGHEQVAHDATMLGAIALMRRKQGTPSIGPWFLTLDNVVTAASEAGKEVLEWEDGLALQPRTWLNYLLAFTPAEVDGARKQEVARALIQFTARGPDLKMDVATFARLTAPKVGLIDTDASLLTALFLRSPLAHELAAALQTDSGEEADEIARTILSDRAYVETFARERGTQEKLRHAAAEVQKAKEENRALREANEQLRAITVNVNVNASATATARAEARVQIEQEIQSLVTILSSQLPGGFEAAGIPPPPTFDKLGRVREWLETVQQAISTSSQVGEAVKGLLPYVGLLIGKLQGA